MPATLLCYCMLVHLCYRYNKVSQGSSMTDESSCMQSELIERHAIETGVTTWRAGGKGLKEEKKERMAKVFCRREDYQHGRER